MGYKAKGTAPNHINQNKCQRKFQGARPNGPPSPVTNPMRVFIQQHAHKMSIPQMLSILNAGFGADLHLCQLKAFLRTRPEIRFGKRNKHLILEFEMEHEDPLEAADLLPQSTLKEYDKLYEDPGAP